ncbi:polyamine-modulated factor 1-binding protein [Wolffia australiana]
MDDTAVKDADIAALQSKVSKACVIWEQELEQDDSKIESWQETLQEMKTSILRSQDIAKDELDFLWKRVRTTATLLTFLKSEACITAVPQRSQISRPDDVITSTDEHGTTSGHWSDTVELASVGKSNGELPMGTDEVGTADTNDGAYINQIFKSVQLVKDVMESLATRVLMAETKVAIEKEKVSAGKEEIRKKSVQIKIMSAKVQEMENFAHGTNNILNEMRQKVEDMVEETSRQRLRAAENERELCRVKQDFESLKTYVCGLIGVREALAPPDQALSTENFLGTLIDRATRLQSEKVEKEAEVQGLLAENVRLNALLDKKEAQLLALSEQCKFMALREPNI